MSNGNFLKSDLNRIHNIVQSSMLSYPKAMIINTLRDHFSYDSYYQYSKDKWGFANTTDHTDLPPGDDIPSYQRQEGLTTRLYIGENYRYDGIYYPAILVKSGGSKYVQTSINRDKGVVKYEDIIFEDGYGNQTTISNPAYLVTSGAWEGSINIDVLTRSSQSRDDLVEAIAMCFTEVTFEDLECIGVVIKPLTIGAPSESDDRVDKLFRQTLTLDIRTEWRREIPVSNVIDAILFTVYFQDLSNPNSVEAQNLTIETDVSLTDLLLNI